MGKNRKGHNWKARTQRETNIDQVEEKKIKLDLEATSGISDKGYDDCNALVLPSVKRKTKIKKSEQPTVAPLSKKRRKLLEKIVQKKEKKVKRAEILESLQQYAPSSEEMSMFTSISEVHSGKYKRELEFQQTPEGNMKVNAISGSNKKRKLDPETPQVQPESSSSSETSSDEDESYDQDENVQPDSEEKDSCVNNEVITASEEKPKPEDTAHSESKVTESVDKNNKTEDRKPAVHIPLNREATIQESRLKLPILAEEQVIMETINDNAVVILSGETGSGKTTQVPQFLYEAGYAHGEGIIGITEPRRVAAISMSQRVATEMSLSTREVSYQIRYEGNVTADTRVKFMTDGVLLKEVQKVGDLNHIEDFMLSKYSVIIVDEAHERSVYTDILLGLLSRIVPLRHKKGKPLKLIIMSATLRVEDFTENNRLFKITPPVVKVDARQFPVTVHFNKRTPLQDYLGEAYKKICKIHRMLPDGGILVFVTGQQEVHTLCSKLRKTFPYANREKEPADDKQDETTKSVLPKVNLDDYSILPVDEEAEMVAAAGQSDGELSDEGALDSDADEEIIADKKDVQCSSPLHVLPLYSLLSTERQKKVFSPPPEGSRLCVVATNVAETSLTIPGIKYVVDTGKTKTKLYDKVTGVSTFKVTWTSQASANQRAGRAGRVGPGHCYRLYSSAVFNDEFEKFSPPEITRRPVDDLVLQMKDMNIDKVVNFPFPTPPAFEALKAAETLLISLGALKPPAVTRKRNSKKQAKDELSSRITPLGKAMACFPVAPRYAKMLSLGHQHNLLPYIVAVVSALSVQELFSESDKFSGGQESEDHKAAQQRYSQIRKTWAGTGHSMLLGDLMVLLKAVGACEYAGCTPQFCEKYGIRFKAMKEIRKLRAQLTNSVNAVINGANLVIDPKMQPPTDLQAKLLRQIVLSGLGDHIARKMPDPLPGAQDAKKLKHAYQSVSVEDPVFIHPASVLLKKNPPYVVYQDIAETSKLYMRGVSTVEPEWLPEFLPSYCHFSAPLDDPPPRYNPSSGTVVCHMTSSFGKCSWQVPAVELEYPEGLDRYKWFARFLLEGKVLKKLEKYVPILLSAPSTMIKSWARLQPRTEILLKTLVSESVDCKEDLLRVLKAKSKFLLQAYLEWIPEAKHDELRKIWPPI